MCGRFYVDDEMARELEKICNQIDEKNRLEQLREKAKGQQGRIDIYPGTQALFIREGRKAGFGHWGYERSDKRLLVNKRIETLEEGSFGFDFQKRRCVIPARGFYEWNEKKEQFSFRFLKPLYMAGIYHQEAKGDTFTILTTSANPDVESIHNRMPLLLDEGEVNLWLNDLNMARNFCKQTAESGILLVEKIEKESNTAEKIIQEKENLTYQQIRLEL